MVSRRLTYILVFVTFLLSCSAELFALISREMEVKIGRAAVEYHIARIGRSQDDANSARVQRIGSRIVATLGKTIYPYSFTLIADPIINACAYPGGFILINQGLVAKLHSDDALAFVIAHEVAHAANRHTVQCLDKLERARMLAIFTSAAIGDTNLVIANDVLRLLATSYSRDDERGADSAAVTYMTQAGYNPEGAIEALQLLAKLNEGIYQDPYLRTHPAPLHRIELIQDKVKKLKAEMVSNPPVSADTDLDMSKVVGQLPEVAYSRNTFCPLAVGSEWQYEMIVDNIKMISSLRVLAEIPFENARIYRTELSLAGTTRIPILFYTSSDQIWQRRGCRDVSSWLLDCIIPMDAQNVEIDGWRFSLVSIEDLLLPCGLFKGVKHISKRSLVTPDNGCDLWLAESVGVVKRIDIATGCTETLMSYSIKN